MVDAPQFLDYDAMLELVFGGVAASFEEALGHGEVVLAARGTVSPNYDMYFLKEFTDELFSYRRAFVLSLVLSADGLAASTSRRPIRSVIRRARDDSNTLKDL